MPDSPADRLAATQREFARCREDLARIADQLAVAEATPSVTAVCFASDGTPMPTVRILGHEDAVRAVVQLKDRVLAAEANLATARERDAWLSHQLAGAIEAAEAVAYATGLATARALLGDLKDARAALAATAPQETDG